MHSLELPSCGIRIPPIIGNYHVTKIIGRGGFAVVVLAYDPKTLQKVAIKIIDREQTTKQDIVSFLESELRLCIRFNHPNIIKVHDIIYEKDIIMIIMDYLKNGDLQSLLNRGIHFTVEEQVRITQQILEGLQYLHQRGIAHHDIKPENILFDAEMNPKLIDFGLSMENSKESHAYCGTPLYMSPEIVNTSTYDGMKSDIWALGVTLHLMSTGHYPWDERTSQQHLKDIEHNRLQLFVEARGIIGSVIKNCLVFEAKDRASVSDLLKIIDAYNNKKTVINKANSQSKPLTGLINSSLPRLVPRNNTPLFTKSRVPQNKFILPRVSPNARIHKL